MALFPADSVKPRFCNFPRAPGCSLLRSYYPDPTAVLACNVKTGLGCSPFARRYSGNRFCFLFLRVLRCFNSPGVASTTYGFSSRYYGFAHSRFSDSVIPGSKDACSSPRLIAACHDLHRLPVPRHPPYALIRLTILFCLLFPANMAARPITRRTLMLCLLCILKEHRIMQKASCICIWR